MNWFYWLQYFRMGRYSRLLDFHTLAILAIYFLGEQTCYNLRLMNYDLAENNWWLAEVN